SQPPNQQPSQSPLIPYTTLFRSNNAVEAAMASGVTDATELALVESQAYPHYLHVMAILFVTNIIIMLVIGKLYPRKTEFVLEYTEKVNIEPYKYLVPVVLFICAIVVGIYYYFS